MRSVLKDIEASNKKSSKTLLKTRLDELTPTNSSDPITASANIPSKKRKPTEISSRRKKQKTETTSPEMSQVNQMPSLSSQSKEHNMPPRIQMPHKINVLPPTYIPIVPSIQTTYVPPPIPPMPEVPYQFNKLIVPPIQMPHKINVSPPTYIPIVPSIQTTYVPLPVPPMPMSVFPNNNQNVPTGSLPILEEEHDENNLVTQPEIVQSANENNFSDNNDWLDQCENTQSTFIDDLSTSNFTHPSPTLFSHSFDMQTNVFSALTSEREEKIDPLNTDDDLLHPLPQSTLPDQTPSTFKEAIENNADMLFTRKQSNINTYSFITDDDDDIFSPFI